MSEKEICSPGNAVVTCMALTVQQFEFPKQEKFGLSRVESVKDLVDRTMQLGLVQS